MNNLTQSPSLRKCLVILPCGDRPGANDRATDDGSVGIAHWAHPHGLIGILTCLHVLISFALHLCPFEEHIDGDAVRRRRVAVESSFEAFV